MTSSSKAPVVFLHGDLQNHTVFAPLAQFFNAKGHPIHYINLPGNASVPALEKCNLPEYISTSLKEMHIEKPILFGNSSGGTLLLNYALQTHNASMLILINTTLGNPKLMSPHIDWDVGYEHFIKLSESLYEQQTFFDYMSLQAPADNQVLQVGCKTTHPSALKNAISFYKALPPYLPLETLSIPVLLFYASGDPYINKTYMEQAPARFKHASLTILEGTHHLLLQKPQEIINTLEKHYTQLERYA